MKKKLPFLYFIFLLVIIGSTDSCAQIKTIGGKTITEKQMDVFIQTRMDSLKMPGLSVAVINSGKIVYHRTFGVTNLNTQNNIDKTTLFEAASLTKPAFAYFTMIMVNKGILDLDNPLYEYLPYPDIAYDDRYKLITARMVLSHTSGFPNWRFMNEDKKLDIKFTPGKQFQYSGEGYDYLAKVIAFLTSNNLKNLDKLVRQEMSVLLRLKHFYFTTNEYVLAHLASPHAGDSVAVSDESWDRTSLNAAASLHSEAIDYAKFLIAVMNERLLKKEINQEMLREQVKLPESDMIRKYAGYTGWALGFALKESPYGTLYLHAGNNYGFQSAFIIHKEQKTGYVFFTNCDKGNEFNRKLEALFLEKK